MQCDLSNKKSNPCEHVACTVRYRTHAITGWSETDFTCTSKIDVL